MKNKRRLPWSVESRTAALHSSIRAEWRGTYRSCALPHRRTCLNFSRLLFWLRRNMNDRLTSDASFMANCNNEPDFFNFCMNHIPGQDFITNVWKYICGLWRLIILLIDIYLSIQSVPPRIILSFKLWSRSKL